MSITREQAGQKGRTAQKEQEDELKALLADASLAFQEGKEKGEPIQTTASRVAPLLLQKYPNTVLRHGKKLVKLISEDAGLEGLEEMFY